MVSRLKTLTAEYRDLKARLEQGGGPDKIKRQHEQKKLTARERVTRLVDAAGVNLPYQEGVFPGQYGASRIFYYNSIMRRYLRVPQLAAVMGPCIAGGAYLPALSDLIVMVKGSSFMGLGGPNLVKGATGQSIDGETLGGAVTHTQVSGVAHYMAENDEACLVKLRELIAMLPVDRQHVKPSDRQTVQPSDQLYDLLPTDHRMSYDMHAILKAVVDDGELLEFQEQLAREIICGDAKINGISVGIIANQRGLIKG